MSSSSIRDPARAPALTLTLAAYIYSARLFVTCALQLCDSIHSRVFIYLCEILRFYGKSK